MSTSPELKACPFCNHAAYLATWTERIEIGWDSGLGSPSPMFNTHHEVRCGDKEKFHNAGCGAKVRGDSEAEAIANWNRRASLSERDAVTQDTELNDGVNPRAVSEEQDGARLDWLEVQAHERDGLLLHSELSTGRCGLGLAHPPRSLREAIDSARGTLHARNSPNDLSASSSSSAGKSVAGDAAPPRDTEAMPRQIISHERHSPPHDTIPLQVWVDVDAGIAEDVRWLNDFGIRTLTSCEGGKTYRPYVMVELNGSALPDAVLARYEIGEGTEYWCYLHPRGSDASS